MKMLPATNANNDFLIILGMHRSGTSLLSNVLHVFGCDMALKAAPTTAESALRGNWEREDITALHDAILKKLGRGWGETCHSGPMPKAWWRSPGIREERNAIKQIVSQLNESKTGLLGVKDPRTTRLLPMWLEICRELKLRPRLLLAIREPNGAAKSFSTRDGVSIEYAYLLWLTYNLEAIKNSGGEIEAIVDYDDWFDDPVARVRRLLEHLDLPMPFDDDELPGVLGELISDDLRHAKRGDVGKAPPVLQDLYADLRRYGQPEAKLAVESTLVDFERNRKAFLGWFRESERLSGVLAEGKVREVENAAILAEAERLRDGLAGQMILAEREMTALKEQIGELERASSNLTVERDQIAGIVTRLEEERREKAVQLAALTEDRERAITFSTDRMEQLALGMEPLQALASRQAAELAEAVVRTAQSEADQRSLIQAIEHAEAEAGRRNTDLLAAQAQLARSERELAQLQDRYERLDVLLADARGEASALRDALATTNTDYEVALSTLAVERAARDEADLLATHLRYQQDDMALQLEDRRDEQRMLAAQIALAEQRARALLAKIVSVRRASMTAARAVTGTPPPTLPQDIVTALLPKLLQLDPIFYLQRHADVAAAGMSAADHYRLHGRLEARTANPVAAWLEEIWPPITGVVIGARMLFDRNYYIDTQPDVAAAGVDPLEHYEVDGWREGRSPNPYIDPAAYAVLHPEAAGLGPPLLHYALMSGDSSCDIGGIFDDAFYREAHLDAAKDGDLPLLHFITQGLAAGARPSISVDPGIFLSKTELHDSAFDAARLLIERVKAAAQSCESLFLSRAPNPAVSVIVASKDNATSVACCLAAIKDDLSWIGGEAIVADRGSHDMIGWMSAKWDGVKLVRQQGADWAASMNRAAAQAAGDVLVFIDGNVEPQSGSLLTLVKAIRDGDLAAVGGCVINPAREKLAAADELDMRFAAVTCNAFLAAGGFGATEDPEMATTKLRVELEALQLPIEYEPSATALLFEASSHRAPAAPVFGNIEEDTFEPRDEPAIEVEPEQQRTRLSYAGQRRETVKTGTQSLSIVIAEGSRMNEHDLVAAAPEDVRVEVVSAPHGSGSWAAWANQALLRASADLILFMGPGVVLQPGCLAEIVDTFRREDRAAVVGGAIVGADGRLRHAGTLLWRDGSATVLGAGEEADNPLFAYQRQVDALSPELFALRRSALGEDLVFDEAYGAADSAVADLCLSLGQRHSLTLLQPLAQAVLDRDLTCSSDAGRLQERQARALGGLPENRDQSGALRRGVVGEALLLEQDTPTPDHDAGSLLVYEFTRTLMDLGYGVTYVAEYQLNFEGRYTVDLQRIGVRCVYKPFYQNLWEFARDHLQDFALLVPFRAPNVEHYLRIIAPFRTADMKVLCHTVDIHHLREEREAELHGAEHLRIGAIDTKAREMAGIRASSASIVVSQFEAEYLQKELPDSRIAVLPLIMDPVGRQGTFEEMRDIGFIGGFRHAPNIDAVQYFVSEIWPKVCSALPDACFRIMGSHAPKALYAMQGDRIIIDGYVEDLPTTLGRCRVSVAPLRFGAGIKGKVGSSLSFGVPCVATGVASEGARLGERDGVIVADTAAEFAAAVVRLYTRPDLWAEMSEGGLAFVEREYSRSASRSRLAELLESLDLPIASDPRAIVNVNPITSAKPSKNRPSRS